MVHADQPDIGVSEDLVGCLGRLSAARSPENVREVTIETIPLDEGACCTATLPRR